MRDRYDGYLEGSATWNPASFAASFSDSTTTTVTVSGAQVGDYAIASFSQDTLACVFSATVTAANTVTVSVGRVQDATIDIASGTLRARVFPF